MGVGYRLPAGAAQRGRRQRARLATMETPRRRRDAVPNPLAAPPDPGERPVGLEHRTRAGPRSRARGRRGSVQAQGCPVRPGGAHRQQPAHYQDARPLPARPDPERLSMAVATSTGATYQTVVTDGPLLAGGDRPNLLFVGAQPANADWGDAAGDFTQTWGELGARARYEDVTVLCELVVQAGESRLERRRTDAQVLLAAVESDLRTDFTLSIGRLLWCHVSAAAFRQRQDANGSALIVAFTVTGRARLASQ